MLKVLIADDEPRVGQLVKHLIHWDECCFAKKLKRL